VIFNFLFSHFWRLKTSRITSSFPNVQFFKISPGKETLLLILYKLQHPSEGLEYRHTTSEFPSSKRSSHFLSLSLRAPSSSASASIFFFFVFFFFYYYYYVGRIDQLSSELNFLCENSSGSVIFQS